MSVGSAVVFGSSKGEWRYLYEGRATNSALIYLLKLLSLLPPLLLPLLFRHVEASCLFDSVYVAVLNRHLAKKVYININIPIRSSRRNLHNSLEHSFVPCYPYSCCCCYHCRFHVSRHRRESCFPLAEVLEVVVSVWCLSSITASLCFGSVYVASQSKLIFNNKRRRKHTDTRFETRWSQALIISSLLLFLLFLRLKPPLFPLIRVLVWWLALEGVVVSVCCLSSRSLASLGIVAVV